MQHSNQHTEVTKKKNRIKIGELFAEIHSSRGDFSGGGPHGVII